MSEKPNSWHGGESPDADIIAQTLALGRKPCRGCFSPAGEDWLCEACRAEDEWDGVSSAVRRAAESTRTERDVRAERDMREAAMLTPWQSLCESLFAREISEREFIERAFDLGKRESEIAAELRRVRVKPPFEVVA